MPIQQIDLGIGDRTTNRHAVAIRLALMVGLAPMVGQAQGTVPTALMIGMALILLTLPEGHVNRRFSWPVEIMELDGERRCASRTGASPCPYSSNRGKETCLQCRCERLPTAYDLPQTCTIFQIRFL